MFALLKALSTHICGMSGAGHSNIPSGTFVDESLMKVFSGKVHHWHGPNAQEAVFFTDEDNRTGQRMVSEETVGVFSRLVNG